MAGTENNEHTALTAQVVEAHEEMTSTAPTPVEYGTIQAVVRDHLSETDESK